MYIEPNTDIYLLSGINWTNDYNDTVYFSNKSVQYNYMKNKVVKAYTKQSYQRHSKGTLRILGTAENLFSCNYLMFQNTSYGSKWFYAFITNCEYINDNTTEITYEIDEIQTWFWDLELGQCFVEREIPETDNLYENLVPETLETGDYIVNTDVPTYLGRPCYVMCCAKDIEGKHDATILNNNTFTLPLKYYAFWCNDPYDPEGLGYNVFEVIEKYYDSGNSPENIIAIMALPSMLLSTDGSTDIDYNTGFDPITHSRPVGLKLPDQNLDTEWFFDTHIALNGYIPKNNKLHTYPYRYIQVSNNSGQINTYKYEDFNIDLYAEIPEVHFKVYGTPFGLPSIMLVPLDYKGVYQNFDEACVLTNFPTIPWVTDTYKAYLAQNKASITTSLLSSAVTGTLNLASGFFTHNLQGNLTNIYAGATQRNALYNELGVTRSMAGQQQATIDMARSVVNTGADIASTLAKISDVKQKPDTVHGLSQCDMLMTLANKMHFDVYTVSIKAQMAKIIDDYFSAYGYAQHKIKKPNINSRPYWNYTQTKGCILKGSAPASSKTNICKIFDNGIRFWQSNEVVGDYTRDNRP